MIDAVEVWLLPQNSSARIGNSGLLSSVIDLDDSSNLTSFAQADDYASVVTSEQTQGHYRHFVPHIAIAAYGSSGFAGYANRSHQWIDCTSSGVPHYGVKIAASPSNSVTTSFDLRYRIHLRFRSVR